MKISFSITIAAIALLLFTLAPAVAQEGPDEWEPNDDWRDATEITGLFIEGEIGRRGDEDDWFVLVDGQEGYLPYITIWYDDDDCDIDMEIYSGSGRDRDLVGSLSSIYSPDGDEFEVDDTCYLRVIGYTGNGDYTIEIEPENGGYYRPDDCEGYDEVESNDDWDLADLITGYVIEGYACVDDDDWFELDGQEGYYPYIELEYDDDECDIDLEVYSGSGRSRDLVDSLTSLASPDGEYFDVDDTCYIHVYAFDGEGEYWIYIEPDDDYDHYYYQDDCEGPDEIEPNDDRDLADSIGSLFIEGYACEDDVDWYELEGQEGRRPEITLIYDDDECDIDLEVWSDDDVVGSLTSSSSPDWDDFRVPGTCWLKVYSFSGEGWYEIEIEP